MGREGVGVWVCLAKKSVGVLGENGGFDNASAFLGWVCCAFGGFVLRAGVARIARGSRMKERRSWQGRGAANDADERRVGPVREKRMWSEGVFERDRGKSG